MAEPLPPGTRVEREEGVLRISLPPRPLGAARLVGLFLVPFGAVFAGGPLSGVLGSSPENIWVFAFLIVFILPFVAIGLLVLSLGLSFLFPRRTTLALERGVLRSTERFGPFWWSWSVPRNQVRGFQVERFSAGSRGISGVLAVDVEGRSKKFTFGRNYPAEWLDELAQAMSEAHGSAAVAPTIHATPVPVAVPPLESPSQPAESDIVLEYTADSVRFKVPRKGIWKANGCLLLFGLLWSALSGFMFLVILATALGGARDAWGGVAFLLVFVAIGAAMVLGSIHSGIKTAALELGPGSLVLRKSGLFGPKLLEWPRKSVQTYSVEGSGWEVNDVRQWQLRVDLADTKPLKLLRGRSTEELEWIAAVLRSGPIGRVEAAPGEVKADGAECQVCNSPMTADIVFCARCRTPHHGDCWKYLGQCSTYGCRESRYTTA